MHEFKYRNNQLYCENVRVADVAKKIGTPVYIYSHKTLIDHFLKLKSAFSRTRPLICYSVKANSNLAILRALVEKGAGLDVVSGGELFRAIRAGCPPERIVYASVGKTSEEIEKAIRLGILSLNVESLSELESIDAIANSMQRIARVSIRINPDIEPKTHRFITTGKLTNKFGIDFRTAYEILRHRRDYSCVSIIGLHIHIGSQITQSAPFVSAIGKMLNFAAKLKKEGVSLEYLNIGGGLGIVYDKEAPQTAEKFANRVSPLLRKSGLKIILEPGRFIVGNAGILVTKVLYRKTMSRKRFVIVDAAMNDLIRPALYEAHHNIIPLQASGSRPQAKEKVDIVGPICESGDFFAKNRKMPRVNEGDLLAIMSAGAYGFVMSSNYNSRPRPAEVMVNKNKFYPIRKRENYKDLIRGEKISR